MLIMLIATDTEVGGLDLRRGLKPFMISTCDENLNPRIWEWDVNPKTRKVDVKKSDVLEIRDYLTDNEPIFHHAQFDLCAFANIGLRFKIGNWIVPESPYADRSFIVPVKIIHETLFASHLVDSRGVYKSGGKAGAKSTHALKELCLVRLNVSDSDQVALKKAVNRARNIADKLGWKKGEEPDHDYWLPKAIWDVARRGTPEQIEIVDSIPNEWGFLCRNYSTNDVKDRTLQLFYACREILQSDGRWEMYLETLHDLPMIYMIEDRGVRIHQDRADKLRLDCLAVADDMKKELQRLSKIKDFNPNSPDQMNKLLFHQWKLPKTSPTKKSGNFTVDAKSLSSLQRIAKGNAKKFLDLLIGYDEGVGDDARHIPGMRNHLKTVQYTTSYERERIENHVHPTIHGVGTGTTRWSMSGFNGQNVGKKTYGTDDEDSCFIPSLRSVFGPDDGHIWVSIDYSQLEPRIFATLARDEEMLAAFEDGMDFHSFTTKRIAHLFSTLEEWEIRRLAKGVNFKALYGGINSVDPEIAKLFPSARRFMNEVIALIRNQVYVTTADNYPLYTPPDEPFKGVDYIVQGTAGRIIKLAMRWLCEGRVGGFGINDLDPVIDWENVSIVVQIHDELVFDIDVRKRKRKDTVRLIRLIMRIMEEAGQSMGIITPVEGKIHPNNWADGISVREYLAC